MLPPGTCRSGSIFNVFVFWSVTATVPAVVIAAVAVMRFARVVGAFGVGIESESTAEKRFYGFVRIAAHARIYRYADRAESRARSPRLFLRI